MAFDLSNSPIGAGLLLLRGGLLTDSVHDYECVCVCVPPQGPPRWAWADLLLRVCACVLPPRRARWVTTWL